ncbi:solute symporter family protein [Trichlorobacter lovleyi]|uniref:SSS sodium solute transporter superfamily n=1 Tax=Trichlorobacter lovleyi (strain ATCC BAA-1151 / DSM 17278 / SZ) TaxID=398767 RepID=B3E881_TRIL1|nr:cation acetate symporter [Trichlorobacter lovleyi]ACD95118.1 SSS sodium solute transporter superfamily [Trichlorobacter lovleyi SZ]
MKRLLVAIGCVLSLSFAAYAEPAKAPAAPEAKPAVAAPAAAPAATVAPAADAAKQAAAPAPAPVKDAKAGLKANPVVTIPIFLLIIGATMAVVVWSAKKTKSAADFYTAGGGITGTQNGWAIAGDYMSAASFLGISGMISLYGYDGFMYSVGWLVAYITVLLIVAEPCRNAGKYTLGDILSFRTSPKPVRAVAAISTVSVSTFYLTAQMVGAGKLMQLLLGVPYKTAIIGVGILMVGYVVFGGMTATTWVQIIKAGLLMTGAALLSIMVSIKSGFNPFQFFSDIATSQNIIDHVKLLPIYLKEVKAGTATMDAGQRFLEPGLFLTNPLDQISLGMALVLGTAGMPHILMRFFTVPTAQAARKSVIVAMFIIGSFYILTTLLGFGAAIHVTPQGIKSVDAGGNMAAMMLAKQLGSEFSPFIGDLLLAFLCAVAFATILAVVSGLVLAASAAIAHDIYVNVIKDGHADQSEQVFAARTTSFIVGAVGIIIGIAAEKQNVAHLVALAFAVASSGNLPVVVMSLFWKKFNTAGVIAGLVVGTVASIGLVMISPNMTYPEVVANNAKLAYSKLEKEIADGKVKPEAMEKTLKTIETKKAEEAKNRGGKSMLGLEKPLFTLKNPGIVSIPLGFIAAILATLAFPSKKAEEMWDEIYVRQNTGLGMAKAVDH